ncbi:NAD(P)/FAD-dependent oxidoreductase [Chloroflexota bacterium]
MAASEDRAKYLIIGNSAGGIGAAEAIRETDTRGSITMVSDEPYPVYSRPLISEYLATGCSLERMLYRSADFYAAKDIETILGKRVLSLDAIGYTATLDDGSIIAWEKLLLATGGEPIIPPIKGIDYRGVFNFITLDDAAAITHFLNQFHNRAVSAVVIGGGLIGVSATEALVKRGIKVTMVEMKDRILNTILDEDASAMEAAALQEAGVNIITGHTVAKVESYTMDMVNSVELEDGTPILCNLVLVAIGVRPRLGLVDDSSIETKRGILVDAHMATSHPDIYACGDVAEAYDFIHGENRLTPIWPNAYAGGRVAGDNMAGVATEYPGGTSLNALKYFGLNAVSAGMVTAPDDTYETLAEKKGANYRKVILRDNIIMGLVFVGDIEKSGIIYNLMKDRVNVESFKQILVSEEFGLASLPEEMWRTHLEMPAAATAQVA